MWFWKQERRQAWKKGRGSCLEVGCTSLVISVLLLSVFAMRISLLPGTFLTGALWHQVEGFVAPYREKAASAVGAILQRRSSSLCQASPGAAAQCGSPSGSTVFVVCHNVVIPMERRGWWISYHVYSCTAVTFLFMLHFYYYSGF